MRIYYLVQLAEFNYSTFKVRSLNLLAWRYDKGLRRKRMTHAFRAGTSQAQHRSPLKENTKLPLELKTQFSIHGTIFSVSLIFLNFELS